MKKRKTNYFICMAIVFAAAYLMTGLMDINNAGSFTVRVHAAENQAKAGWNFIDGNWYYYGENGYRKTGWLNDGGNKYYLKINGKMATGWTKIGMKWYYFYSNGAMAFNTSIDGYELGADGAWITAFNISDACSAFGYPYNQHQVIRNKVEQIVQSVIKDNMSDFEKEKVLHDYLVSNTRYDYENYRNNSIPGDSYSAYGALINGTAVCEGYAQAMYLLLSSAGIDTDIVTGSANNGNGSWISHTWNIVKIGGEYYQLDPTWDDPVTNGKGIIRYSYFNVTDEKLSYDHIWNKIGYPASTGVKYNYDYYTYCTENNIPIGKEPLTIYGTVSLPAGEYAPAGGLTLRVAAEMEAKASGDKGVNLKRDTLVIIPEGQSSAAYTLSVPQTNTNYQIYYNLVKNSKDYALKGYYSSKETVLDTKSRVLIGETNKFKADLTLIKTKNVTGTISLPNGEAAPKGGLEIQIISESDNGTPEYTYDDVITSTNVTMPEGVNYIPYSLYIPSISASYTFRYSLATKHIIENSMEYLYQGYYTDHGTVWNYNERTQVDISNMPVINLSILKGVVIEGTAAFPSGEAAPKGGLKLNIVAQSTDWTRKWPQVLSYQIISEGTKSVHYRIIAPVIDEGYIIHYWYTGEDKAYANGGYYSNKGRVTDFNEGTVVGKGNTSEVNITILIPQPQ